MKNVTARASTLPHVEWGGIDVSLRLRRSTKLLLALDECLLRVKSGNAHNEPMISAFQP
jgi:hypothetical protein